MVNFLNFKEQVDMNCITSFFLIMGYKWHFLEIFMLLNVMKHYSFENILSITTLNDRNLTKFVNDNILL